MEWSADLIRKTVETLAEIRQSLLERTLPLEVFEAHLKTFKTVSTEAVLINEPGEVFLSRRPSSEKSPHEPFPGQWHCPGVTHLLDEDGMVANTRLFGKEIGTDVRIIDGPARVTRGDGSPLESFEPVRGRYLLLVLLFRTRGIPKGSHPGRFFAKGEIPWDEVQVVHRNIILPAALDCAERLGWLSRRHTERSWRKL